MKSPGGDGWGGGGGGGSKCEIVHKQWKTYSQVICENIYTLFDVASPWHNKNDFVAINSSSGDVAKTATKK